MPTTQGRPCHSSGCAERRRSRRRGRLPPIQDHRAVRQDPAEVAAKRRRRSWSPGRARTRRVTGSQPRRAAPPTSARRRRADFGAVGSFGTLHAPAAEPSRCLRCATFAPVEPAARRRRRPRAPRAAAARGLGPPQRRAARERVVRCHRRRGPEARERRRRPRGRSRRRRREDGREGRRARRGEDALRDLRGRRAASRWRPGVRGGGSRAPAPSAAAPGRPGRPHAWPQEAPPR